jgi:hypothetical protein
VMPPRRSLARWPANINHSLIGMSAWSIMTFSGLRDLPRGGGVHTIRPPRPDRTPPRPPPPAGASHGPRSATRHRQLPAATAGSGHRPHPPTRSRQPPPPRRPRPRTRRPPRGCRSRQDQPRRSRQLTWKDQRTLLSPGPRGGDRFRWQVRETCDAGAAAVSSGVSGSATPITRGAT